MKKIRNFRWWVVGLIALITAINYLDRQNLPVAISEIKKTIPIDDFQYGMITSLFLLAYGVMYAVGGRLLDVLGSKTGYVVMVVWWSLANMIHAFVHSVLGLGIARFLLGIGEGGAFPGSAKVVAEWFPARERSLAFGIFNTGSSLGAVVAPPFIAFVVMLLDWRWTFIISGLIGLVWVVLWWILYDRPSRSKFITTGEREYVLSHLRNERESDRESTARPSWAGLFRYRKVWGLILVKFLPDSAWYFFIFWLPKYLNEARGLDIQAIGSYGWAPYAFAGGGSFLGGLLSSYLLKRNFSLDMSRKIPLAIAACLLPASLLITGASLTGAILFFGMAMFGHQLYSTIVQTLVADMFPSRVVGSVSGLMGCGATCGAMLFSLFIGFIIEQYGYSPAFIIAGLLHPLSFLLILAVIKKIEMVDMTGRKTGEG